jgi:hypothetical protein
VFKVLMGCMVAILLVVVGGGIVGYNLYVKPAVSFVGDATRFVIEFESYNEGIRRAQAYVPPAGTELQPDQLQRFMAAQGDMKAALAGRLGQLNLKYQELERNLAGREPNLREMFGAYQDIADLLLMSKRNQIEALNRHDFSLQEYAWVRQQAYQALGQQVNVASLEQSGATGPAHFASDQALALVEPHREQLAEMYVLAWFGL